MVRMRSRVQAPTMAPFFILIMLDYKLEPEYYSRMNTEQRIVRSVANDERPVVNPEASGSDRDTIAQRLAEETLAAIRARTDSSAKRRPDHQKRAQSTDAA